MSKNSGSRSQASPYQLDELFAKFHRTPAGVAWRWRAELAILAILAATLWRLSILITITWAGVVMAAALALLAGVPHSRRFTIRRLWCILARHRIHRLCWEARLHTRAGRLPLVMWIRPTQVGERAWLLCRAGISAEDFADRTEELRAACYAREARVTASKKWSQLVTVDIVRHDPLGSDRIVSSQIHGTAIILPRRDRRDGEVA